MIDPTRGTLPSIGSRSLATGIKTRSSMWMIGNATAPLAGIPRRWVHRRYGCIDTDSRQKWRALRDKLVSLPQAKIRLLDAGCGPGLWSLELAATHPSWTVIGIDRREDYLEAARARAKKLKLKNAHFVNNDFLDFQPAEPFDVVLSVCSAHYLSRKGQGAELFDRIRSWLKPTGSLILLGPRLASEVPFCPWLPHPGGHAVYSANELTHYCARNGLVVDSLEGVIGRAGTLAKQIAWTFGGRLRPLRVFSYPFQLFFNWLDERSSPSRSGGTSMWVLVAHRSEARAAVLDSERLCPGGIENGLSPDGLESLTLSPD